MEVDGCCSWPSSVDGYFGLRLSPTVERHSFLSTVDLTENHDRGGGSNSPMAAMATPFRSSDGRSGISLPDGSVIDFFAVDNTTSSKVQQYVRSTTVIVLFVWIRPVPTRGHVSTAHLCQGSPSAERCRKRGVGTRRIADVGSSW